MVSTLVNGYHPTYPAYHSGALSENWVMGISHIPGYHDPGGYPTGSCIFFFIRDMVKILINLVNGSSTDLDDPDKIKQLLNLLDQSKGPLFVHMHLMGTHGGKYPVPVQVFSKGEKQNKNGMVDYYDDAILSFDSYVGEVIDHLKANGQFENTILIIFTDHDGERLGIRSHPADHPFSWR